ncbi:type II secretion system F family protein [Actinopolymorpha pittospori]
MSGLLLVCAGCAAAAVALVVPDPPGVVLGRRLHRQGGRLVVPRGKSGLPPALGAWIRRLGLERPTRRTERRQRAAVLEAVEVLAAELRSGRSSDQALRSASGVLAALVPVAAVSRMGGDVPSALRAVRVPGTESLSRLAVAWAVAGGSGSGLAGALDRIAHGLRAEERLRQEVATALAAPRATARMLACLPLLGLGLGASTGANPFDFLFGTPIGLGCLVVGSTLAGLGLLWVERLARRAEEGP